MRYPPVQIATAYDGNQPLDEARLKQPDLAVMDVSMPHLGGVSCFHGLSKELHDNFR